MIAATALAAVAAVGVALIAMGSGGSGDDGARVAGAAPPSSSVPVSSSNAPAAPSSETAPPPTTSSAPVIDRTYDVTTAKRTFVDRSRPTSPNGDAPGTPERTLVTSFWLPDAPGTFPLVVFAHGYAVTPDFYAPMLERWAAAGYVVAAPTYPILSGIPGGPSHTDYEQTFDDTSFVITSVAALGGSDAVGSHVDGTRVSVAGHSDGEVIAFGVGFLECCRDPRVRSVIAMAGDLSNANNPHVLDTGIPILHVMETGDEYDPYPHSIAWDIENLTAPRWILTLQGATHVPPYTVPGNPSFELLAHVAVDFFDGTLKDHPERLDRISDTVAASPAVASLER